MSWGYGYGYREYVPVAARQARARKLALKRAKSQKRQPHPVEIAGRTIAKTFWGKAWCEHLESYSDYANRLPRGRTYVRNGSVVDLKISAGRIDALVAGSDVYEIDVVISPIKPAVWRSIRRDCAASIDSVLDLLGGQLSDGVMERLTQRSDGMFPQPSEIQMDCSCPDWAGLCKHLAAVLYGVGAHLDHNPELLFLLRGVDQSELVGEAVSDRNLDAAFGQPSSELAGADLGAMFGIELDTGSSSTEQSSMTEPQRTTAKQSPRKKSAKRKSSAKEKSAAKKKATKKKAAAGKTERKASASEPAARKSLRKKSAKKKSVKKKTAGRTVARSDTETKKRSVHRKTAKKRGQTK